MIQLFSKSVIIQIILVIAIIIAGPLWLYIDPVELNDWVRLITSTISLSAIVISVFGILPIWRLMWFIFRPLNWWIFPDLNGSWGISMNSNIGEIAKYHPKLKKVTPNTEVTGTVTIIQNWFGLTMVFHGDDGYSDSETIFVKLTRTKESKRFKIAYLYENETPTASDTDEQRHFGAGRAEVRWVEGNLEISGHYWTNRKWRDGMNTAGTFLMSKKQS